MAKTYTIKIEEQHLNLLLTLASKVDWVSINAVMVSLITQRDQQEAAYREEIAKDHVKQTPVDSNSYGTSCRGDGFAAHSSKNNALLPLPD